MAICVIILHLVLLFSMQELADLSNLLIWDDLLKIGFRFCSPFVHENKYLFLRGHFFI